MTEPICRTCKAWCGGKEPRGVCRRRAPSTAGVEPASWPNTAATEWCLDHIPQETKRAK
jgi:hypothetical protein